MSFPNIPDINSINMTLEDTLNLLLTSIALEEISLSKLLDAETKKLVYVLEEFKLENMSIENAKDINKSVNQTITNMIKLQMLLEHKMENILELLPAISKSSSNSTTSPNTTTTSTNSANTASNKEYKCSLEGKAKGYVSNKLDNNYNKNAILKVNIRLDNNDNSRAILYMIKNDIGMVAYSRDIDIEYPSPQFPYRFIIRGMGTIKKRLRGKSDIVETGRFILKVWIKPEEERSFHFKIVSLDNPELNHDSGLIQSINSNLVIK